MFDLEQILYLLSARGGAIGRSSLERAVAEFGRQEPSLNNSGWSGFEALRALDWLGHCEITGCKGRVTISLARASLARLPGLGEAQAVLTGARSATTLSELQELCRQSDRGARVLVSKTTSTGLDCISIRRVVVQTGSFDTIQAVADSAGIPLTRQPAGWDVACASMSVADFANSIHWESAYPVPQEAEHFSPDSLRFDENYSGGIRLSRWKESATDRMIYALRNNNAVAFLDSPEWGRHVELSASGASSISYDGRRKLFAIRAAAPPPRLLARALCLCSGNLPTMNEPISGESKSFWLTFENVPLPVAKMVAEKLGQETGPLPF